MGGAYMVTGSLAYLMSAVVLRHAMRLSLLDLAWISIQASWPVAIWGISFLCMLDEEPEWLMDVLHLGRLFLPPVLHANLCLVDAETVLIPIVRLTEILAQHESSRLRALNYQRWWHTLGRPFFALEDRAGFVSSAEVDKLRSMLLSLDKTRADVSDLMLRAKMSADLSVSAGEVRLVLTRLVELLNAMEGDIESNIASLYDQPLWGRLAVVSSRMEQALADELDTLRYLRRRLNAIPVMPKQSVLRRNSTN
ncbi:hypothetical protein T492DRAFT_993376 [Pavlovales sp. CCMP2436]|nr:hypothetical protein T492DRAFT_993376 [Pavlovales sp. CCMP2436]